MRKFVISFFMCISSLFEISALSMEKTMGCRLLSSTEGDFSAILMNCVNVVNGDLCITDTDLIVEAPDNLILQRYYNSHDYVTGEKAGAWRIYAECLLVVGSDPKNNRCTKGKDVFDFSYAYAGDRSGGIVCYSGWRNSQVSHDLKVDVLKHNVSMVNTSHIEIGGRYNSKNNTLHYDSKKAVYELSLGDGRIRYYQKVEKRPQDLFGSEIASLLAEKVKQPEYFLLLQEKLPSGNNLFYEYDAEGKLTSVCLKNPSKGKILAFINFDSQLSNGTGKIIATSSNSKTIHYCFNNGFLGKVSISDRPERFYQYSAQRLLSRQEGSLGHFIQFDYDNRERVSVIKKPSGILATLTYEPHATTIAGALGNKRVYRYDDREQLSSIECLDQTGKPWKIERRFWGSGKNDVGILRTKSIEESSRGVVACTTYAYDEFGNVTEERSYGNFTGLHRNPVSLDAEGKILNEDQTDCVTKKSKYSRDGRNLLVCSGDVKENFIRYGYVQNTSLLQSEFFCQGSETAISKRHFYYYNEDGALIKKITDYDNGSDCDNEDSDSEERHFTVIVPKEDLPGIGLPLIVEQKVLNNEKKVLLGKKCYRYDNYARNTAIDVYDADNVQRYTLQKAYDAHGNLIAETDPEGNETLYVYDENDHCLSIEAPQKHRKVSFTYDSEDNIVEEIKAFDDLLFVTHSSFDRLGRKLSAKDQSDNLTQYFYDDRGNLVKMIEPMTIDENGSSVKPEWNYTCDFLGHVLSIKNPKGHLTTIERNIRGDPLIITYPDGTQECFKYDSEGSLHRSRSRDGIVTSYSYDKQGRLKSTDWSSIHPWGCGEWTYNFSQTFDNTHVDSIKRNDLETKYVFRKSGRLRGVTQNFSDKISRKKEITSYDPLGRISTEKIWFSNDSEEVDFEKYQYDLLDHLVAVESSDSEGTLWSKRLFTYNPSGECVEEKALIDGEEKSLGKMSFNSLGDPVSLTDSAGHEIKLSYDYFHHNEFGQIGVKQTAMGPKGVFAEVIFDNRKRPIEITLKDPANKILSREKKQYDVLGNLTREIHYRIDSNGVQLGKQISERQFGPMNRLESLTEFAQTSQARTTLFTYDNFGRLLEKRLKEDKEPFVSYVYGENGKIESIQWKKEKQKFSYDANGYINSATYGKITIDREYNAGGELLEETVYDNEDKKNLCYTLRYAYDLKGRIIKIILPDNSRINYEYGPFSCKSVSLLSNEGKELFRHIYSEYDSLGRLKSEQMIGFAGNRIQEWGKDEQKKALLTDFLSLRIPEEKRDELGNIRSVVREKDQGTLEQSYEYDLLNRLVAEKAHSYAYDSLNRRIAKDKGSYEIDDRGQLLSTPKTQCIYNAYGFLIQKGSLHFDYDSSGLLTTVTHEKETLANYVYDAFGRRIMKETPGNGCKKIYFYCGEQELGFLNDSKEIVNLRVPGVSGGNLSPESVMIQIKKEIFSPLHDFSGNVIALIDPNERQMIERYDYTAFGEEDLFDENDSPLKKSKAGNFWRYAEKTVDEETGLVFFGRRYFDPELGQWISPDPSGFIDGPNLYAYVQNNPLSNFDAYGLSTTHRDNLENCKPHEHERYFFRERTDNNVRGASVAGLMSAGRRIVYDDRFEDTFEHDPTFFGGYYEHSRIYDLNRPELPNGLEIMFINGMRNNFDQSENKAFMLSRLSGGYNIHGIYNATHGLVADLYECELNLTFVATPPVRLLHQAWDQYFERTAPENPLLMICTSQGTIQVRDALIDYPMEKRERIIVVAIAPAAYIWKGLCKQAYHYVSPRDIVPKLDVVGRQRAGDTVFELPRHPSVPCWDMDHGIESLTYSEVLERQILSFINDKGSK